MRTSIAFVVVAAASLGLTVSQSSFAGSQPQVSSASCSVDPYDPGTKYCSGSLEGFVYSSGATDFAEFLVSESYAFFYASYHGTPYMCTVNNPTGVWLQVASLPYNAGFSVQISANGECSLNVVNSSIY